MSVVHFEPATFRGQVGLASLNFRESSKDYIYGNSDLFLFSSIFDNFAFLKNFFKTKASYQSFLEKFFDYIDLKDLEHLL